MLDLNQVRSFVAVAEELHFGRAARRLNITQPPLSRQIRLLEQELGAALFARTSRAVVLTAAGRVFLGEARLLLKQSEGAVRATRRALAPQHGTVMVGVIGTTAYGFLPRLIARARAEAPEMELALQEMLSVDQMQALGLEKIDVGLVRPVVDLGQARSVCVHRERLVLALPLDHPLAGRQRPLLPQLEGEPFIMYSAQGAYLRGILNAAFRSAGVQPKVVQQMSQAQSILSLVSTGMGVAIVPEETRNASFDNIIFRPIDLGEGVFVELHAVWLPTNRNPALPVFLKLLGIA